MQSRVALVTGGGSGIGAGVAQELADLGHHVAVLDRTAESATAVADQIHASGGTALAVQADVSDPDAVAHAGRTLEQHLALSAKTIPVGRIGTPHDIARAVLFFAAEDADFVTGQVIYVSGGPHG